MPKHRITLAPPAWPPDLKARFDAHPLTTDQRTRLRHALGRWFRISADLGLDPRDVSRQSWLERLAGLPHEVCNDVRQALAIAFPHAAAALYAGERPRAERPDARSQLDAMIARNLAKFPDDWRDAAVPLLHVEPEGFGDGILVQAWAPSTIQRRLETAAMFFNYCRSEGLPVDISPSSVRAKLRHDQERFKTGDRRLGGVAADMTALAGLGPAIWPARNWAWLKTARDRIKKLARHHGSRNAARAVDAAELRAAGQQLLEEADQAHAAARNRRGFVKAHTRARTALTMILLSEAPIRISSCAELELEVSLLGDLAGLFLDAGSTKEGDSDRRAFSATLIDAIGRYIRLHRAVVAAPGETRLFVSDEGGPIQASQLSKCLGDYTEPVFEARVTPHAIRHSVGNFIVASAPEEAALASIILNHRSDAVTPVYHQRAKQIVASRRLAAATESAAAEVGADTFLTRRTKGSRARPRSRTIRTRQTRPPKVPTTS